MIKAFMFGTKTNEKPAFNHETNEEEYITKVALRVLSPKSEAIPYEHQEVYILTKEEYEAKPESPEKVKNEINEKLDSVMALMIEVAKLNVEDK